MADKIREALEGLGGFIAQTVIEKPVRMKDKERALAYLSTVREWVEAQLDTQDTALWLKCDEVARLRKELEFVRKQNANWNKEYHELKAEKDAEIARLRDWLAREAETDKAQKAEIARLTSALEAARALADLAQSIDCHGYALQIMELCQEALSGATEKGEPDPPCKTCGGSGEIETASTVINPVSGLPETGKVPCPRGCKPKGDKEES
jgi:hypothetical protein